MKEKDLMKLSKLANSKDMQDLDKMLIGYQLKKDILPLEFLIMVELWLFIRKKEIQKVKQCKSKKK